MLNIYTVLCLNELETCSLLKPFPGINSEAIDFQPRRFEDVVSFGKCFKQNATSFYRTLIYSKKNTPEMLVPKR